MNSYLKKLWPTQVETITQFEIGLPRLVNSIPPRRAGNNYIDRLMMKPKGMMFFLTPLGRIVPRPEKTHGGRRSIETFWRSTF